MRNIIIVIVVLGVIVYIGGAIDIRGASIFERVDALIGYDVFMDLHYTLFGFMHREPDSPVQRMGDRIDRFGKQPLGIDNKRKYRQLDDAAGN